MANPIITKLLGILAVDTVPEWGCGTGRKWDASCFCCAADSLKTTRPTIMPAAKKMRAMMSQSTPQTAQYDVIGQHRRGRTTGDIQTLRWAAPTDVSECRRIWWIDFTRDGIIYSCNFSMIEDEIENTGTNQWRPKQRIGKTWPRWTGSAVPFRQR